MRAPLLLRALTLALTLALALTCAALPPAPPCALCLPCESCVGGACVDACPPDQLCSLEAGACVPRCGPCESWTGNACVDACPGCTRCNASHACEPDESLRACGRCPGEPDYADCAIVPGPVALGRLYVNGTDVVAELNAAKCALRALLAICSPPACATSADCDAAALSCDLCASASCAAGVCVVAGGGCGACASDAACADADPCTRDYCAAGVCVRERAPLCIL